MATSGRAYLPRPNTRHDFRPLVLHIQKWPHDANIAAEDQGLIVGEQRIDLARNTHSVEIAGPELIAGKGKSGGGHNGDGDDDQDLNPLHKYGSGPAIHDNRL